MADINFGILDTQMPGRIAAIPQQQQAQQAQNAMQLMQVQQTMQQNALAKSKMDEYTRGVAEKNALRGRMTQPGFDIYDPKQQAEIMGLSPELAPGLIQHALKVRETETATAKNVAQTGVAQTGITKAKRDFGNEARRSLSFNPSDANIVAWNEDAVKRKFITQEEADQEVASMLRVPLAERADTFKRAGAPAAAPETTSQEIRTMLALGYPNTQAGYTAFRDAQRPERLLTPVEEAQRVRIARESRPPAAPRPEAAPRTQQVTMADGTLGIMNMDTGAITPSNLGGVPVKGKPSAFAEKNAAQRKQMGTDLGFAITQLADITKDGGLIDQSTGSGAGRLTDIAAGFIGEATPGAIAIGKIAPIADLALKMVPRFEGPQSNADTRSYKEAAGQLADSTLPTKIRKEAGKVVLRIMQTRKNQFATSDMAAESAAGGGEATPAVNIDALLNKYK